VSQSLEKDKSWKHSKAMRQGKPQSHIENGKEGVFKQCEGYPSQSKKL